MDVSIVICSTDDPDIEFLLNSVNRDCEIIVVCNASTPSYEEFVKELLVSVGNSYKLISIPENRLSLAREMGTWVATNEKVIHIDTDCVFSSTALDEFNALLENNLAVNGRVEFLCDDFQSRIVAAMRSYGLPNKMLCPSIGFHRRIANQIGGYCFDKRLSWIEDSEFNNRLMEVGVKYATTKHITCSHKPLTFHEDLHSAFSYGKGAKRASILGLHPTTPSANWFLIPPMFSLSILHGIYAVIWNLIYCAGYYLGIKGDKS